MQETFERPHPTLGSHFNRSGGLSFTIDYRDHLACLAVTGELDMATVDSLTDAAIGALQLPVRVLVLDLGGVSFCGAAGVSALITIRRVAAPTGIRVVLTSIQPHLRRVLDIVGMSAVIPIVPIRKTRQRTAVSETATVEQQSTRADNPERHHSRPLQAV